MGTPFLFGDPMKVHIVFPWKVDTEVGGTEAHYGVNFTVAESSSTKSIVTAELPDDEATAMIEAGRVAACVETKKK